MSRQPAGQKVNSEPHSEELAHRLVLRYFITHKLFLYISLFLIPIFNEFYTLFQLYKME